MMLRNVFALSCALALTSSCDSGSVAGAGVPDGIANCQAFFQISGTHVEGPSADPDGADPTGCQPQGVYSITLTPLAENPNEPEPSDGEPPLCAPAEIPALTTVFQVEVIDVETGDDEITLSHDPEGTRTSGKVTRDGNVCSAEFEELLVDNRGVLLTKASSDGNTLSGIATFDLFDVAQ